LGEIDASVEERTHGEFAWLRQACAAGQGQLHNVAQDDGCTVGRDLDDVIGGVGMRLGEVGDDHFVDAMRVWRGRLGI